MGQSSPWGPRPTEELIVPAALGLLLLYFVAAWTVDAVQRLPPTSSVGARALITMSSDSSSASSYADVLTEVTSLGLRLAGNPCVEGNLADGAVQSADQRAATAQEDNFAELHLLLVAPTVLAPPDWAARLASLPGVTDVNTSAVWNCPAMVDGSLLDRLRSAPPRDQPTVLHFANDVAYGDALRAASDLGLRLADPCYEAALANGDQPTWRPANQQAAYAASGDLIVAPTILTPSDWPSRLASGVTLGPVIGCASS
jgi:hypothetical protein